MSTEAELVHQLKTHEQIVQLVSVEDLESEYLALKGLAKDAAGYVSPFKDAITAATAIREFGVSTNKVVFKSYAGKQYVIFKGYAGNRNIIRGTRYLVNHPKVVRIGVGPKAIAQSVKGGFALSVVLSVGIEVFDFFIRDTATLSQLLGNVTSDLIKIGLASIAAAVAGLAVGTSAVLATSAALPFIAAVGVGVIAGVVLNKIDERIGMTRALIEGYRSIGESFENTRYEINRQWNFLERNPQFIPCLFGPCAPHHY